jgi:hypothetical protein
MKNSKWTLPVAGGRVLEMNSTSGRMKNSKQTPLVTGGRFKWTPLEAG